MIQDFTPFSLAFARTRFRRDIRRSLENGNPGFDRYDQGAWAPLGTPAVAWVTFAFLRYAFATKAVPALFDGQPERFGA
jgi:hypothetical protein